MSSFAGFTYLENVFKPAVVFLEDGVFGAEVEGPFFL
jgi:hypothetical protein